MVIDSQASNPSKKYARLVSPTLDKSPLSTYCLRYSLFMNGEDVGKVNVLLIVGFSWLPLAVHSEPLGNEWTFQKFDFSFGSAQNIHVI